MQEVSGLYTSPFLEDQLKMMVLRARKVSEAFEKRPSLARVFSLSAFLYSCSKTNLFCFV